MKIIHEVRNFIYLSSYCAAHNPNSESRSERIEQLLAQTYIPAGTPAEKWHNEYILTLMGKEMAKIEKKVGISQRSINGK